jgi:hypothetical protein
VAKYRNWIVENTSKATRKMPLAVVVAAVAVAVKLA